MGINLCRGRAWGLLASGAVCAAILVVLAGCKCANSGCRCTACLPADGKPDPANPKVITPRPGPFKGGQPIMPASVGLAKPGERLTVFATIKDPKDGQSTVTVTTIVKMEGDQQITFDKIGKIEYLGAPYDSVKGMTIPGKAKQFSFDIVFLDAGVMPHGPPDVVGCIFSLRVVPSTEASEFGVVVDLP